MVLIDVFEFSQQVKEWQDAWDEGDKKEVEKQGLDQHGMSNICSLSSTNCSSYCLWGELV